MNGGSVVGGNGRRREEEEVQQRPLRSNPPLVGRIEFQLGRSGCDGNNGSVLAGNGGVDDSQRGKKRKREGEGGPSPGASSEQQQRQQRATEDSPLVVGYVFHPCDDDDDGDNNRRDDGRRGERQPPAKDRRRLYLLSVPNCMLPRAHRALLHNSTVRITRYAAVEASAASFPSPPPDAAPAGASSELQYLLLEVHADGMEVVSPPRGGDDAAITTEASAADSRCASANDDGGGDGGDPWTLSQIRRRELVDAAQKRNGTLGDIPRERQRYSLRAVLSSISPILFDTSSSTASTTATASARTVTTNSSSSSDPFALLELYDPASTLSCVAVLRKMALLCHPAIVGCGGSTSSGGRCGPAAAVVTLKNAPRQRWRAPDVLGKKERYRHLRNRIPRHVFVVENPGQIEWHRDDGIGMSSLPRAVVSGKIISVRTIHVGNERDHIHYVDIIERQPPPFRHLHAPARTTVRTLFLTYFPMPSPLQLALRPGACIEATNVHQTSRTTYCACLRSGVSIVRHASEGRTGETLNLTGHLALHRTRPCDFLKVRKTYFEFVCRQQLSMILSEFQYTSRGATLDAGRFPAPPSLDELTGAILGDTRSTLHNLGARNAYAEFFDHETEAGNVDEDCSKAGGCQLTRHLQSNVSLPLFVPFSRICEASVRILESKLSTHIKNSAKANSGLQVGWTGSVILGPEEIGSTLDSCSLLLGKSNGRLTDGLFHTFGFACSCVGDGQIGHLTIRNGRFSVPAAIEKGSYQSKTTWTKNSRDQFVMLGVRSVIVSFVCLEVPGGQNIVGSKAVNKTVFLPPYDDNLGCAFGPCAFISRNGYVFMTAVHFDCTEVAPIGRCIMAKDGKTGSDSKCCEPEPRSCFSSIQDSLDPNMRADAQTVLGLLNRRFFKLARVRHETYRGFTISLSHVPIPNDDDRSTNLDDVSTLQSVEVKPPVTINKLKHRTLQELLQPLLVNVVQEDLTMLALSWWSIASSERAFPLLGGGWDEIAPGASSRAKCNRIFVHIPSSTIERDWKRGYVRFRCSLGDLSASIATVHPKPFPFDTPSFSSSSIDFVGGQRFFPGMLTTSRERRLSLSHVKEKCLAFGPLLRPPINAGIPRCTLADLHWDVCADLRAGSRTRVSPSLVRSISNASFLGISYCQALPECTGCFQALKHHASSRRNGRDLSIKKETDGIVTSVRAEQERSYWDRPLSSNIPKRDAVDVRPGPLPKARAWKSKSPLRCPNNCGLDYASIKWECSGTLDDGTGQAKLYAERDTALLLLGMTAEVVEQIERGAWLKENGIVFSRGMPPKAYLRGAVGTARVMAQDELARRRHRCGESAEEGNGGSIRRRRLSLRESDVLKFLTPEAVAEYMMQLHCRNNNNNNNSGGTRHRLHSANLVDNATYFVRCKPVSDEAVSRCLNETQIELRAPAVVAPPAKTDRGGGSAAGRFGSSRPVPTYTLPPLKLNLVDCCLRRRRR